MANGFTFYSFLALLCCLLAGVFFAWLLYGHTSSLTKSLRRVLAVFRALSLSLILWLLFSPLIREIGYTLEKPIVVIAQDHSQSIGAIVPAGFDSVKYRKDLQQLRSDLSQKYEVRTYTFGDHVSKGLNFGYTDKFTNATTFINKLNDELMNRNVGAVILATDGIFNKGGNPADEITAFKAPLYTIALGDTVPKKDVLMVNVNTNELVYLDDDFKMDVEIQAYQCKGEQTKLSVMEDGKKVFEQVLLLKEDGVNKVITVSLKATKLGIHQYTLVLSSLKGEISLQNNHAQVSVEVIDDRQKILIAAAGPHPDLAALKEAIAQNKHYDVSLVMGDKLSGLDPKKYGLIILYQLPGISANTKVFTDKIKQDKIPLWFILGAQSDISQFNLMQSGISLGMGNGQLQYAYSEVNGGTSLLDLDQESKKVIENFDALQLPAGQVKFGSDFQAILNQRRGKLKTNNPLLFFTTGGGRKTGYLLGEGLWKWKLSEARENDQNSVFNALIGKIVQYLSAKDDKRKFIVHPSKQTFDENEAVLINATLYNDSYIPVNTPDVSLVLKDEKGKSFPYTFSKLESAYQLDAGILPSGNYTYKATTTLAAQKYTAEGSFFINTLIAEFQQTIANHQLLFHLSNQTKGKMYTPDQLLAIKDDLYKNDQIKTLSYEDRKYEELINFKYLFIVILALLTTEWFLRKRNGAI